MENLKNSLRLSKSFRLSTLRSKKRHISHTRSFLSTAANESKKLSMGVNRTSDAFSIALQLKRQEGAALAKQKTFESRLARRSDTLHVVGEKAKKRNSQLTLSVTPGPTAAQREQRFAANGRGREEVDPVLSGLLQAKCGHKKSNAETSDDVNQLKAVKERSEECSFCSARSSSCLSSKMSSPKQAAEPDAQKELACFSEAAAGPSEQPAAWLPKQPNLAQAIHRSGFEAAQGDPSSFLDRLQGLTPLAASSPISPKANFSSLVPSFPEHEFYNT